MSKQASDLDRIRTELDSALQKEAKTDLAESPAAPGSTEIEKADSDNSDKTKAEFRTSSSGLSSTLKALGRPTSVSGSQAPASANLQHTMKRLDALLEKSRDRKPVTSTSAPLKWAPRPGSGPAGGS
jgi:hypothetical protein